MAISNMAFNPPTGLNDANYSPQTPPNEAAARAEIQGVSDQLRDYINNTLIPQMIAGNIPASPISVNSGNTVQAQLAWLLAQIAIAATGAIPDGSIGQEKLTSLLSTKIDTALSNTGILPTLTTTDKSSLVNAINEVLNNLTSHLADFVTLEINQLDTAIELEILKGSILTGVDSNICIETFQNINDVVITHGSYNSTNKRVELNTNTYVKALGFSFE